MVAELGFEKNETGMLQSIFKSLSVVRFVLLFLL